MQFTVAIWYCEAQARVRQVSARDGPQGESPQSLTRVTVGHLRVTVGYLQATVVYIRVTLAHLRVTIDHLRVTIGYFFL